VAAHPERYELHYEDETHLETNPHLGRVWHRVGQQPTLPAAGTNRRLTVFGSVEAQGRGRVEVLQARQDSAGFARYLAALDARHEATGRHIILVLDNGPCHVSTVTRAALAERAAWLEVIPLARYSPHLNPKEREWRLLRRDHGGHLAPTPRDFGARQIPLPFISRMDCSRASCSSSGKGRPSSSWFPRYPSVECRPPAARTNGVAPFCC